MPSTRGRGSAPDSRPLALLMRLRHLAPVVSSVGDIQGRRAAHSATRTDPIDGSGCADGATDQRATRACSRPQTQRRSDPAACQSLQRATVLLANVWSSIVRTAKLQPLGLRLGERPRRHPQPAGAGSGLDQHRLDGRVPVGFRGQAVAAGGVEAAVAGELGHKTNFDEHLWGVSASGVTIRESTSLIVTCPRTRR